MFAKSLSALAKAAIVFALVGFSLPAAAQITTGSMTGTVKDEQGGVIPGATVTLVSEARGIRSIPIVTNGTGDFVFANINADTYTIEISMPSFKMLKRGGVEVSPGSRVTVGTLVIAVGGAEEVVQVKAEAPLIQTESGERSFTVTAESVQNLPMPTRSFMNLVGLAPGMNGINRIGPPGQNNIQMDGVSAMDTTSGTAILNMNLESIAEVKVLTSSYQAEFGRSAGVQISAVTKSGGNQFHGALYDVDRNSDWNMNSQNNILNGDPKTVLKERDWGGAVGGPVGKPGGHNKLFFYFAMEDEPRTGGNDVARFRVPTALERAGDFSKTTDNNGTLYNLIRDSSTGLPCTAANTAGCFRDGGVLGRIPANRLYQTGLNVLNLWPLPNLSSTGGLPYNYEITRPTENILSMQPVVKFDYQASPSLRASFKYSRWQQRQQTLNGTLPGFDDSRQQNPFAATWATTINYTLNSTTLVEATYGEASHEQGGCTIGQGVTAPGPVFCQGSIAMSPVSSLQAAGLGALPFLYPDANVMDPSYYATSVLNRINPPFWDGHNALMTPTFAWGSRVANAPPNVTFPRFLEMVHSRDFLTSLTRLTGPHTFKTGFYFAHALKVQQSALASLASFPIITFGNDTSNPLDSTFGFANAALGIFSQYQQGSKYTEGNFVFNNIEGYAQDTWKVNSRLTLDYGLRIAHQQPMYDTKLQGANFLPDKWVQAQSPLLYVAGCPGGVSPCQTTRQALNPLTGQLLGPNSALAIGTLVPNSGNLTNGLFLQGQGIVDTYYKWPDVDVMPRVGVAYDVTGRQRLVVRGGAGLFFGRGAGGVLYSGVTNPPTQTAAILRYGQLQDLSSGLRTSSASNLTVYEYDAGQPRSTQWNAGAQTELPWRTSLDVSYVGVHSSGELQSVDINAVDFGTAFLPQYQDRTLTPSTTPGATALTTDLLRPMRGYGTISQSKPLAWRTSHSLQISLQRRFGGGLAFGFNDNIQLYDRQNTQARLQHNADGSFSLRDDQAQADELLGNLRPQTHIMRGTFVWDLPDLKSTEPARRALGLVVNDWQLSGSWSGATGADYTIGYTYASGGANINLTGSPNYAARVRIVGDPGSGCSSDVYRQFNTAAFQGPLTNSVGLESGNGYLKGCFTSQLDLSIARNIKLGGSRSLQLRLDVYNVANAAGITGRNTTMNLTSPSDPVTVTNLPFDANGNLVASRSLPKNAGFGAATSYQTPRTLQAQVRFSF